MTNVDSAGGGGGGDDGDEEEPEPEPCPVCGKGENPTPGETPAYVDPPRVPRDDETLLGRGGFNRLSGKRTKGAQVFKKGSTLYHRDTLHKGKGAEIETYRAKNKKHKGAICAHCGSDKEGSKVDGRKTDP